MPHVRQVVHAVTVPPALYVPFWHIVHTPPDLYAPKAHTVGQLVVVVPDPVYALRALPLVQGAHADVVRG